jgi:hypothetical protein
VDPATRSTLNPKVRLRAVKLLHTAVWAIFATCVGAIPLLVAAGQAGRALAPIAVVAGEVVVLAFNRMRCPLTDVAARYTDDRRDNFDIYLPAWLARHNKTIFGSLYAIGVLYAAMAWLRRIP